MQYSERFQDIAVTHLDTAGFEKLDARNKMLAYYLAQAGLWGRYISLDQGSEHNIPMFRTLLALRSNLAQPALPVSFQQSMREQLDKALFVLFAHNGVYHSTTGEKVELPILEADLEPLSRASDELGRLVGELRSIWYSDAIKPWRTVQTDGVDIVAASGGNFYKGLTTEEVKAWRAANYPQHAEPAAGQVAEIPPYGFNERLVKNADGTVERQTICVDGLYGPYVQKIVENLKLAKKYAANELQWASIDTLIMFYESGTAEDFDTHCVAWTRDKGSDVYYINGLIESYDDPMGIGCGFESIVAFKNPVQTAKVEKIIDNIQWFEDNLPFDPRYKKPKAQGLSASSISVVSMAGETSPSLPLGINLPNSDWIRAKHGSKSVNLENSASSRSAFEKPLREALYLPKYQGIMDKYLNLTSNLHTDLHEIAGHGSGQLLPGVSSEALGQYYSIIEECRADLVALYFMADPKLKEFGVYDADVDVEEAARAQYVAYLTNGLFGQLRRIKAGQPLTQAHMRNRQIIAQVVLGMATEDVAGTVTVDGNLYVEVRDVHGMRQLFGKLLATIQKSKSEGQFDVARDLVLGYGTDVNQSLLEQMHQRIAGLDMPKTVCFVTPELLRTGDEDVQISHPKDFLEQQIALFSIYCNRWADRA